MSQRQIDSLRRYVNKSLNNITNSKTPVVRYKKQTYHLEEGNGFDISYYQKIYDFVYLEDIQKFVFVATTTDEDETYLIFGVSDNGVDWQLGDLSNIIPYTNYGNGEQLPRIYVLEINKVSNIGYDPINSSCFIGITTYNGTNYTSYALWFQPNTVGEMVSNNPKSRTFTGGYIRNEDDGYNTILSSSTTYQTFINKMSFIIPTYANDTVGNVIPNGAIVGENTSNIVNTYKIKVNTDTRERTWDENHAIYIVDPTVQLTGWTIDNTVGHEPVSVYFNTKPTVSIDNNTPNPMFLQKADVNTYNVYGFTNEGTIGLQSTFDGPIGRGRIGSLKTAMFSQDGIFSFITYKQEYLPNSLRTFQYFTSTSTYDPNNQLFENPFYIESNGAEPYLELINDDTHGLCRLSIYGSSILLQVGNLLYISNDNGYHFNRIEQNLLRSSIEEGTGENIIACVGNNKLVALSLIPGQSYIESYTLPLSQEL